MRKRNLIIYTLIFLFCICATSYVVINQLTGNTPFSDSNDGAPIARISCDNAPEITRTVTSDPQLLALTEYDDVCKSSSIDTMMLFTSMPATDSNAVELADQITIRLKAFADYNVRPIVVVEPDTVHGMVDFHEYANGLYDPWFDTYFKRLKHNGITDEQLGIWLPFPEPQQEYWNNNLDPDDFALSINRHMKQLRSFFPKANTAILLDSQVNERETSQLVAYTRLIEPGLIDIAGLQGFPWHPGEDDERMSVTSASKFAPAYMLEEVARSLGTQKVLINTGTYRHRIAQAGGDITVPTTERQATLDSIVQETSLLRSAGFEVTVNIFAENKIQATERVDWSYWGEGSTDDTTHAPLLTHFVKSLKERGASVSLYDSRTSVTSESAR